MKHSAQQVSQAWKSYLSNRHSSAQKRQLGGQIDTEKYAAQKTKDATIRFNDTNKQPQDSSLLHFFDVFTPTELNQAKGKQDSMGLFSLLKQKINLNQPDNIGVQARNSGGKIHKKKHKKEEKEVAVNDAQVEHGRASSATNSQHRAGGGIVEGKPGIDTNHAEIRPGSFVIPKKKVNEAINDGIVKPKKAEKFQSGGVPVKLTAGEALLSPEKAASLYHMGVDLNKYAPDTKYPYTPETANTSKDTAIMPLAQPQGVYAQLKDKIGMKKMQDGGVMDSLRNANEQRQKEIWKEQDPYNEGTASKKPTAQVRNVSAPTTLKLKTKSDTSNPQSVESPKELADKISSMEDKYGSRPKTSAERTNDAIQKKYDNSSLLNKAWMGLGQGINNDLYYAGKLWNGIGQGMYDAGKALFYGKDDDSSKNKPKLKKGGAVKMQFGGTTPSADSFRPWYKDQSLTIPGMMPAPAAQPLDVSDSSNINPNLPIGQDINPTTGLPMVNGQPNYTDAQKMAKMGLSRPDASAPASPANPNANPSQSLFDEAMKSEKSYYQTAELANVALLAGNLGSRYVPAPKPAPYNPDIYQRNLAGEQQQANKELDKVAATEQYNSRQTGGGSDPATSANLMDKKLALGAQFDTLKQNEAKSVNDQRNQATLMNTNQSNAYNTREADRLAQFRQEKGQVAGQYTDKLQNLYKSSIEDKYNALGMQNQWNIAKAQIDAGNNQGVNTLLGFAGRTPTGDITKDQATANLIKKIGYDKSKSLNETLGHSATDTELQKYITDNNIQ